MTFPKHEMTKIPVQSLPLVFDFRWSLPPEIHATATLWRRHVPCLPLADPSLWWCTGVVPGCDEGVSRCTWEERVQIQVNIICIVEKDHPLPIGSVCKPTQTTASLCSSHAVSRISATIPWIRVCRRRSTKPLPCAIVDAVCP